MKDKVRVNINDRVQAAQLRRYVAFVLNSCLALFLSMPANATEQSRRMVFYPPLDVAEVVASVQRRQKALGGPTIHLAVRVQFGTRDEWTNACSWMKAQRQRVSMHYVPRQAHNKETKYFCMVMEELDSLSEKTVHDLQRLIDDFTRQFGGAQHAWRILLENGTTALHNHTLEQPGDR